MYSLRALHRCQELAAVDATLGVLDHDHLGIIDQLHRSRPLRVGRQRKQSLGPLSGDISGALALQVT